MIVGIGCVHHLNRLVEMRIERLAGCRNGTQAKLLQCILHLLIDELHPASELGSIARTTLKSALKTVQDGQKALYGVA